MTVEQAREILWSKFDGLTDEDVLSIVALYRAVARIFINKAIKNRKS